jgi:hypothetical protein
VTEQEWQDRYEITSTKGRIWKRSELLKRAVDTAYGLFLHKLSRAALRSQIDGLLNNDAFMRARRGMVPARVVEDLAFITFKMLWPGVKP